MKRGLPKYLFTDIQNEKGFAKVPVNLYPEWMGCQTTCLPISRMKNVCQSTCLRYPELKGFAKVPVYRYPE